MRKSMTFLALGALLLLASAAGGCDGWDSLTPSDPIPELDCKSLFPELARDEKSQESPRPSSFARALVRQNASAAAGELSPQDERRLLLAGQLVGELPEAQSGSWKWAAGPDATLLVHSLAADRPDALLYAEAFSPLMSTHASEEVMRFELTVDPGLLGPQLAWPASTDAWVAPLPGSEKDKAGLRRLAWMASTRTGGRGFGYASAPHTFTGWKWMGRNREGILLHLARSQGEWGGQKPLETDLEKLLPRLVQRFPRLSWLAAVGASDAGSSFREGVAAYMVLGTATTSDAGIHLAVLCARAPACGAAAPLAELLSSLRPARAGESDQLVPKGSVANSPEAFAADLGYTLAPKSELLGARAVPSR